MTLVDLISRNLILLRRLLVTRPSRLLLLRSCPCINIGEILEIRSYLLLLFHEVDSTLLLVLQTEHLLLVFDLVDPMIDQDVRLLPESTDAKQSN